jgi:hypothetical protein
VVKPGNNAGPQGVMTPYGQPMPDYGSDTQNNFGDLQDRLRGSRKMEGGMY